jgi:hypothetical protein
VRRELEISWIAGHRENILGFWAKSGRTIPVIRAVLNKKSWISVQ